MTEPILVTQPLMPSLDRYIEKLKTIWSTQWMTNNGELSIELQNELMNRLQIQYLELFANGHMALDIAIRTLKLTGEVITTPFSFASTTHALTMNSITPVFCDIHADDYTIDESKLEALITPKTSAILPVHVYGNPCHVEKIHEVARKHGLKVIYDAAHAFDVTINGKALALEGDISMLSFHATKVFNTIEGGALVFHNEEDAAYARLLRNFGIASAESVPEVGLNAKMNEFSAAMGLCNLEIVGQSIAWRGRLAKRYQDRLACLKGLRLLDYCKLEERGVKTNYAYMPLEVQRSFCCFTRDELFDALAAQDIFARKYFYPLITNYECYINQFADVSLPIAQNAAQSIMTLPISGTMSVEAVDKVCDVITAFYNDRMGRK